MSTCSRTFFTCVAVLAAACAAPADKSESTATGAAVGTNVGTNVEPNVEPNVAEVRAAIESANQRAAAGMVAGDVAASVSNYSDDAVSMLPGMPMMTGRPAIEAGIKSMFDMMKVNAATFTTTDVLVRGDLAVETGTYDMTTTMPGGKPMADKGKFMTLWKRQSDGTWKAFRDINNSDGPPPPAAK